MGNIIDIKNLFGFWEYWYKRQELRVSNSARKILGLSENLVKCTLEAIPGHLKVEAKPLFLNELKKVIQSPRTCNLSVFLLSDTDDKSSVEMFFESIFDGKECICIKGMMGDVNRLGKEKRTNLQSRIVFDNTSEGILITDDQGMILNVNEGFCRITGYSKDEAIGQNPSILKSGLQGKVFYEHLWNQLKTHGKWRGELWNKRKNNQLFPSFQNITKIPNQLPGEAHYVSIFSDVTTEYENKKRLDELAFKDQLTGLSNRRHFEAQIERQITGAPDVAFYLLFLDLNNFKSINDNYGHAYGDILLKKVASRLAESIESNGLIARFGGDEFTVLLSSAVSTEQELASIASSIKLVVGVPFDIEDERHIINVSIGASRYPADGKSAEMLLKSADTAMYDAKSSKQLLSLFHPEMGLKVKRKARLAQDFIFGLKQGQFHLEYQPKIHVQSGSVSGYEALCRWQHPSYGNISPPEFIAIAEEFSLHTDLGDWVISTAFDECRAFLKDNPGLHIAINVSASQILQGDFINVLEEKARVADIPYHSIELEITETELIQDMNKTVHVLKKLRCLGVSVSIDDFGKGYSSFYYLRNLPVDRIKLDKDCIKDAVVDEKTSVCIISAINSVATELKLDLIVEGVETESQNDLLKRIGVPYAQGYHYAYPQPINKCLQHHSFHKKDLDAS